MTPVAVKRGSITTKLLGVKHSSASYDIRRANVSQWGANYPPTCLRHAQVFRAGECAPCGDAYLMIVVARAPRPPYKVYWLPCQLVCQSGQGVPQITRVFWRFLVLTSTLHSYHVPSSTRRLVGERLISQNATYGSFWRHFCGSGFFRRVGSIMLRKGSLCNGRRSPLKRCPDGMYFRMDDTPDAQLIHKPFTSP
jgi:hypothetical protein